MNGKVELIREKLQEAQAVVIGAGSGLSAAAGLTYGGERFRRYFGDFIRKYGMTDMYSAGFYPFETQEEKWAYWSRHIYYNRYDQPAGNAYLDLCRLVRDKEYFVLTTNVDHQFWLAGFDNRRIFATQGDYGLVPRCPVCGGRMEVNLRCDGNFVEDGAWEQAALRYQNFLQENKRERVVFLELGVGMNTPGIIKFPFWQMTARWPQAFYICINLDQAWAPEEIRDRSLCLNGDMGPVLEALAGRRKMG